jgi:hypothetical protein
MTSSDAGPRSGDPIWEWVCDAAAFYQNKDILGAIALLEGATECCLAVGILLPSWLVLRLASYYRLEGLYEEEVQLLTRFSESNASLGRQSRFEVRLRKAQALADRARPTESIALEDMRQRMELRRARQAAIRSRGASAP